MNLMSCELQRLFGQRIREEREHRGLTQTDLAKAVGIYASDLCDLEKGRHAATLETVEKIAMALGTPAASLLTPVSISV